MDVTYDARVWSIDTYKGKRGNTYYVRWMVARQRHKKPFKSRALAESFRSDLIAAARKGEAFDTGSGMPVSVRRTGNDISWYSFACEFADAQWPLVAATTRRTHAEALTTATTAMFTTDRGKPDDKLIRKALCRWAFNTNRRNHRDQPRDIRAALRWIETHTRPVSSLNQPTVLRALLNHLTVKLDGTPAAPSVANRKRKILNRALEHAVERDILDRNPIPALKWRPPTTVRTKTVQPIDRRRVANPIQVRTLLHAVEQQPRSGARLMAFFGCLYFAALRPEEAVALAKPNLLLPQHGWGELHLGDAEPYAGREWTDTGENRDRRQLKQRPVGETRPVPCCPELTNLIHAHVERFGYGPGGRLFVGERNGNELPKQTIIRAWQRAREAVFPPELVASPLAATPYDLRHAGISAWLNAGVPVPEIAEWAGHSPEILLRIYAKCIDGGAETQRRRIQQFLGHLEA